MKISVQITDGDSVLGLLTAEQFMQWTGVKTQHLQTLVERFNAHNQQTGAPERAHVVIEED